MKELEGFWKVKEVDKQLQQYIEEKIFPIYKITIQDTESNI